MSPSRNLCGSKSILGNVIVATVAWPKPRPSPEMQAQTSWPHLTLSGPLLVLLLIPLVALVVKTPPAAIWPAMQHDTTHPSPDVQHAAHCTIGADANLLRHLGHVPHMLECVTGHLQGDLVHVRAAHATQP